MAGFWCPPREGFGIGALGHYPDAYELRERISAPLGEGPGRFEEGLVRSGEEGNLEAGDAVETPDGDGEFGDQLRIPGHADRRSGLMAITVPG